MDDTYVAPFFDGSSHFAPSGSDNNEYLFHSFLADVRSRIGSGYYKTTIVKKLYQCRTLQGPALVA